MPRDLATSFLVSEHLFSVLNCHTVSLIAKQEQIRFSIFVLLGKFDRKVDRPLFQESAVCSGKQL